MRGRWFQDGDLIGKKFNLLTITDSWIEQYETNGTRASTRWVRVDCDCGTKGHVARYSNVQGGRSRSCGCLLITSYANLSKAPISRTHGMTGSYTYKYWQVVRRDAVPEWRTFEPFYADVGERPHGYSLYRKDPEAPYSKENCPNGWEPRDVTRDKRAVPITIDGLTMTMTEWAKVAGVSRQAFEQWYHDENNTKAGLEPRIRSEAEVIAYIAMQRPSKEERQRLMEERKAEKETTRQLRRPRSTHAPARERIVPQQWPAQEWIKLRD
jgi:hypothetical protein